MVHLAKRLDPAQPRDEAFVIWQRLPGVGSVVAWRLVRSNLTGPTTKALWTATMLADVSYTPTSPDAGVLYVRGPIGLSNARDVCVVMLSLIDNTDLKRLTVDLGDAHFIGAAGALALLAGRRYGASSCAVELMNPSPGLHRMIDILAPDVLDPLPEEPVESHLHADRVNRELALVALLGGPINRELG